MDSVLGENLRRGKDKIGTTAALKDTEFVGVYFGAHWAPPCRLFNTKLSDMYKKVTADGAKFEIVYVSSDGNDAAFERCFAEMPWAAVPYECDSTI